MIVSCRAYERPSAGSGRLTLRKRMFALDGRKVRTNRRIRIRSLLSRREQEVLSWLHEGKTSWDIAMILNITERTVNYHVGNIMQKLDVSSRVHAVSEAGGRTIGGQGHDDTDI
ncbi:MAG: helix-turn-helix domain-containing protein [Thermodesulfovibrionales bacterium]